MAAAIKKPTFTSKKRLVRYVSEENRLSGNRPAFATFLPDPPDPSKKKPYLSVNSLEIESLKEIAAYCRGMWQNATGKVALCEHTVFQYNEAGKKSGVSISYCKESQGWQFQGPAGKEDAYLHHPKVESKHEYKSPSHCGVEFTRMLSDHAAGQFARRLAGQKFHLQ
jgi:hypothetical protein